MSEIRHILATNVKKLMANSPDLKSQGKTGKRGKISQSTVDRITDEAVSTGIDTLDKVAKAFGLEAWQLLHPNMNISVREMRFYAVLRQEFAKLTNDPKPPSRPQKRLPKPPLGDKET